MNGVTGDDGKNKRSMEDEQKWTELEENETISLIRDWACRDKRNGSRKRGPLHVQVQWPGAKRILHRCFHNLTNGQGRATGKNGVCRFWSQELQQFHTQVHLERRPEGAEIVHGSESHSEQRVPTWKHGTRGEHHGWCPGDGVYRNGIRLSLGSQKVLRTFWRVCGMDGWYGKTWL